jgi:hypothetical protein
MRYAPSVCCIRKRMSVMGGGYR